MVNFYELLQVRQTASETEIEGKLDEQYQKWRGLVTHHDPSVVAQANQALQTIEEARSTLLNPATRLGYDNTLKAELATMGGLSDPNISFAQPTTQFAGFNGGMMAGAPAINIPVVNPVSIERTDAWICPSCGKPNPIGSIYCVNDGSVIGKSCPSCNTMVEASNKFCSNCGVDKEQAFQENKKGTIAMMQDRINAVRAEIQLAETNPYRYSKQNPSAKGVASGCLSVVLWIVIFSMVGGIGGGEGASVFFGLVFATLAVVGLVYLSAKSGASKTLESDLLPRLNMLEQELREYKKITY
ncbi:MAG: zinc ribbon domain-containing protein [Anaerolineaceae bacterium]|jgi:RNA polymerase subunit RPABC4/transcription elongation factor Spt4|nr:zinc ribbon domain-containing protein [Anaerolineaceae bacterium]MDD4043481.1 zinc ribbon domain-containing protein [Anaerolineaceae bacterium]MDD4578731.1 zinc ribbon domain-containing protein [Anaerolineaceae bacterium]